MEAPPVSTYGALGGPDREAHVDKSHERRVLLFTCFLCLVVVAEGYDIGVLNGAVVRMKEHFDMTTLQMSLVVAMTPGFIMPGSLVGGQMADAFGRWASLVVCCCLLTAGPLCMALAQSVPVLIAARAIVGFGIGMGYVIVSMYIAEIAPSHMRGRLTTLEEVFLNIGILAGYCMNWGLLGTPDDWRWMLAFGSVLPLVVLLCIFHPDMPESPRWLFARGHAEESEKVLTTFVGCEEAGWAIEAMKAQQRGQSTGDEFVTWGKVAQVIFSSDPASKGLRRMLLAGVVVACSQTGSGYVVVAFYSSTVLKATMSERGAFIATTVMGLVKLAVVLVSLAVLEKFGRRTMLLASAGVCVAASAWLAVALGTGGHWLAQAFGFSFFMAGVSLGLGPVTFVYVTEVMITEWRAKGMALALFCSRLIAFTQTFTFPLIIDGIGATGGFWCLCVANVVIVWLVWALVYETKGRSLEQLGSFEDDKDS